MMTLRSNCAALPLLIIVALSMGTSETAVGLPADPDTDAWNEDKGDLDGTQAGLDKYRKDLKRRQTWNCYNYGVNKKTFKGAKAVRAQPGKGTAWPNVRAPLTTAQWCTKVRNRAKGDGLKEVTTWSPGDPIPPKSTADGNLVALGALAGSKVGGGDYHWWRMNDDGSWSHKRGGTRAKTTYTDGAGTEQPLTDPRLGAERDGYALCGFMRTPKSPTPDIGDLSLHVPACGPQEATVMLASVVTSGMPDDQLYLSPYEQLEVASYLPTFSGGNEVPDPEWAGVLAGESGGFVVFADELAFSPLPAYMRVHLGVVEVFFGDLTETGMSYYNDDQGLKEMLGILFYYAQPLGSCCSDESCDEAPQCTCEALGHYYQGDATVCDGSCPQLTPTSSAWSVMFLALALIGAASLAVVGGRAKTA